MDGRRHEGTEQGRTPAETNPTPPAVARRNRDWQSRRDRNATLTGEQRHPMSHSCNRLTFNTVAFAPLT